MIQRRLTQNTVPLRRDRIRRRLTLMSRRDAHREPVPEKAAGRLIQEKITEQVRKRTTMRSFAIT